MFLGLFINNQKNQRNIKNRLKKSKKYLLVVNFISIIFFSFSMKVIKIKNFS
jgi:hypothetical protein